MRRAIELAACVATSLLVLTPTISFAQATAPSPDATSTSPASAPDVHAQPSVYGPPIETVTTSAPMVLAVPRHERVALPYRGGAIPPGATLQRRRWLAMAVPGGTAFGVSWLASAVAGGLCGSAYAGCGGSYTWLWLPVVGPFVTAASSGSVVATDRAALVVDGFAQAAGLIALAVGLATTRTQVLQYGGVARRPVHPHWGLVPIGTAGAVGFTLVTLAR